MSLFVACDAVARGLASWAFKVPPQNAVIYNLIDLTVTYLVYHTVRNQMLNMRIPQITHFQAHFYAEVTSAISARVAGITAGVLTSRALGYPVRPLAVAGLIGASTVGLCLRILGKEYF